MRLFQSTKSTEETQNNKININSTIFGVFPLLRFGNYSIKF